MFLVLISRLVVLLKMIKNKIKLVSKFILLAFLSLFWFIFIQVEYEILTKPKLQDEFPIIKGAYAVYFTGIILLIFSVLIFFLLTPTLKKLKSLHIKK